MSATFDYNKFMKYFGVENFINVSGFAYPLTEKWDTAPVSVVNYISAAIETVKKIHIQNPGDPVENRDILVFMPSRGEIIEAISRIKSLNKTLLAGDVLSSSYELLLPLIIDREAVNSNNDDYRLLFADIESINDEVELLLNKLLPADVSATMRGEQKMGNIRIFRRVLFGTSVLETGVTIDTLKYVCDSGYHRGPQFISNFSTGGIITVPATKSRIRQRAGRANRKSEGEFWPLYPKYIYDSLENDQLSDLETSDISTIILSLIAQQVKDSSQPGNANSVSAHANITDNILRTDLLDTVDDVPSDAIQYQLEKLYALGFISPECKHGFYKLQYNEDPEGLLEGIINMPEQTNTSNYGITKLGQIGAMFNGLHPEQIKLIMSSYLWGCSTLDVISIAAYMSIKPTEFKANMTSDVKWVSVYRSGLPFYLTGSKRGSADDNVIYRTKLIIADDFIDGLILFNAIEKVISEKEGLSLLETWCHNNSIKYSTCLSFLSARDDIIEQMLQIGLNPFFGNQLKKASESDFMNYIVCIKHCILDAWRLNVARWDKSKNAYVAKNGLKISTPPMLAIDEKKLMFEKSYGVKQKYNPSFIICEGFSLKLMRDKGSKNGGSSNTSTPLHKQRGTQNTASMYEIKSTRISALDGYVDCDPDY